MSGRRTMRAAHDDAAAKMARAVREFAELAGASVVTARDAMERSIRVRRPTANRISAHSIVHAVIRFEVDKANLHDLEWTGQLSFWVSAVNTHMSRSDHLAAFATMMHWMIPLARMNGEVVVHRPRLSRAQRSTLAAIARGEVVRSRTAGKLPWNHKGKNVGASVNKLIALGLVSRGSGDRPLAVRGLP